jgi:MoaA/NifB/PqqE/SkfB family radical SAM enzyme
MLLYVDINDSCNLKCPTCPRGVRAFKNTSKKMSTEKFRHVIAKAKYDGAYQVGLFNWVEPFLIDDLHEYCHIVKSFGLRCEIASTLSLKNIENFSECLQFVDMLWVTVSGFTQHIYETNHKGGKISHVFANLEKVHEMRESGQIATDILIRFLSWDYNAHEVDQFREFAAARNFRFEVLLGSGHPIRQIASEHRGKEISVALSTFTSSSLYQRPGTVCPLIFEHIAVNADGDVYQCSAHGYHDNLRIGSYLDLSREEILYRRYNNPFCNSCDWKRRVATDRENSLLLESMQMRIGRPSAARTIRLSDPDTPAAQNEFGEFLPKDGHTPW